MTIRDLVLELGGFARKKQLVARGAADHHLTEAVRSGSVHRARNGWYSTHDPGSDVFRAVRVGGRLTGASLLWTLGAWMAAAPALLHVSLPRNAARLRSPANRSTPLTATRKRGAVLHWEDADVTSRGSPTLVALRDALRAYLLDTAFEEAVAALDWSLASGLMERQDVDALVERLPLRLRPIGLWLDENCQSYPESITRTRLRLAGLSVVSQVGLARGRWIDLVVEDVVALEVDGRQFHESRFEKDREKDLDITLERRHALRMSKRLLDRRWPDMVRAVRIALEERGVRVPPGRVAELCGTSNTRVIGTRAALALPRIAVA